LAKHEELSRKHELIDLAVQSTATYAAACRDVIAMAQYDFDFTPSEIAARVEKWEAAKGAWRADAVVLQSKLEIFFAEEPSARRIFKCIIDNADFMLPELRTISKIKLEAKSGADADKDTDAAIMAATDRVVAIEKELARLSLALRENVRKTSAAIEIDPAITGRLPRSDSLSLPETPLLNCLEVTPSFKAK
jgi:hypothetical protein